MSRMSSADLSHDYPPVPLPTGPFVLASNATHDADAAFPLAQVLTWHTRAPIEVVSVVGPLAATVFSSEALLVPNEDNAMRHADREAQLQAQMERLLPPGLRWPVTTCEGDTAEALAAHAMKRNARAILVGRTRHGVIPRLLGGETVVRLLHAGDRPVLAVDASMTRLPRRVVIGTDLSVYSHHAARVALSMMAPDASVLLVHVDAMRDGTRGSDASGSDTRLDAVRERMMRMRETFNMAEQQFEDVVLSGIPAEQLSRFATEVDADLLVTATRGLGLVGRLLMGSVATALLREAPCSVLCVPGSARTHAAHVAS